MLYNEERIREDFKNHIASLTKSPDGTQIIQWRNPKSSAYYVQYIFRPGWLCAMGDIGDAIYRWHYDVDTLTWMLKMDIHYFHGKCVASEVGVPYNTMDGNLALKNLNNIIEEDAALNNNFATDLGIECILNIKEQIIHCRLNDWTAWLHENMDELYDSIGDDWMDWLPDIGTRHNTHCEYHFIGIQMATQQLIDNGLL